MATITRENIGLLNDKLTVKVAKEDYLPAFEQSLKKYAKTANIPGFRKGMVPSGLVKKMYGQSVFSDEILRTVEKQLNEYMVKEQLDIFAQPLPLESDARQLDINQPRDYDFSFEIGLKPEVSIHAADIKVTRYKITITDEMIEDEINRLRIRHGKMSEPEVVTSDDNVINVDFTEVQADGSPVEGGITKSNSLLVKYFAEPIRQQWQGKQKDDRLTLQLANAFEDKEREWVLNDLGLGKDNPDGAEKYFTLTITKVGLVKQAELGNDFFETVYPGQGIETEEAFRQAVKGEMEKYYQQQASNQVHDQIYHHLIDHTPVEFPAAFLKRWLQNGGEKPKTAEEAEQEFPSFVNQLKWTLITSKLIDENKVTVEQEEIRDFAKQQIMGYMGGQGLDDAPWMDEYANRMLKDQKFVENTYYQIQTSKLFTLLESQVAATEEPISAAAFADKLKQHQH